MTVMNISCFMFRSCLLVFIYIKENLVWFQKQLDSSNYFYCKYCNSSHCAVIVAQS